MLEEAGFRVVQWVDNTATALAEVEAERVRAVGNPAGVPILGIHVVVGPSFREKTRNSQRAMFAGRIRLINAVLARD
jgi:hypothetical protein